MRILLTRAAAIGAMAAAAACQDQDPIVPAAAERVWPDNATGTAGLAVATRPGVRVTTAKGKPVPGVTVVFAVQSGGGSILLPGQVTGADGVATAGSWILGTTAGANTLTATAGSLTAVTFTATGVAGAAAKLALSTPPSATAANRTAFATQPVVQVQDANSNHVTTSTASVAAGLASGSGALSGTLTVAAVNGVATFTDLSIAGLAGTKTISFTSSGLTGVSSPTITTTAGPAATIALNAGNNQSAPPGSAVAVAPSVKATDADANPVSGVSVTFAVASGGGSVTGANATSDAAGVATSGSWTLGATLGTNTLTASAAGLSGSPVTFTASASNVVVSAVAPATLTPGATATINGQNFGATIADNAVTIDGVAATLTAASATSLTVTVPSLPCTPAHDANVSVSVSGATPATKTHPVRAATQHALTVGQSAILSTATAARCNELSNTGGLYYLSVYNTNSTYSTTGASFELKGSAGASSVIAAATGATAATTPAERVRAARRRAAASATSPDDRADRAHVDVLERNLDLLRQYGPAFRRASAAARVPGPSLLTIGGQAANAVGDMVQIRLPDLRTSFCSNYLEITGRVAYVGTKSIIVEDNANPLAGTIDTTYNQIGTEFDSVMWPILETNYGNALANDAVLDNNGRIIMVFTEKLTDPADLGNLGFAGFVVACDFFPRATLPSSNFGEYFYATAPTVAGTINTSGSPPRWRWSMRGTVIHEVKHIVSFAERISRNGGLAFEQSWLEETTARLAEELYERARYNFTQRSNIGYGDAANPVGPYCGVRLSCNNARGIVRVFEELASRWYSASHDYSPLGRINSSDFSFYATGWSVVRWAIDASANAESSILKGMTQEPTKTGISNLEQATGLTFVDVLPRWSLAMVVDDYPGFTPADATLKQPSWDFRNVFSGYKIDFPSSTFSAWPLVPLTESFGVFARTAAVRPGTAAIIELSGTQTAKQLLELKAGGSSAAAPAELRLAIVRVQ